MKKVFLFVALVGMLAVGCKSNKKPKAETVVIDEIEVVETHNARNSLDYKGTYKGTLPCADCEGIETTLTLKDNGTFERTSKYLGKSNNSFEEKGSYTWNDAGNIITLQGVSDSPSKYFVGENMLRQLDMSGNELTGDLADKYILRK